MALEDLATPINSITADQAREYIKTHKEGSFTILDVRQPNEYEQEHLPGARLIPLPDLADSLKQLDPEKPIIVY
ncbi:MAG: rhodanese-like domain-containing protein [Proteobacteria bacterium]|nr:rhodanese-like domain-containing protein [Pseudomonadota bacterium]